MRIFTIVCLLMLTGCAGLIERATNAQTAVEKLRNDLGADVDLANALKKDISVKNAQMEYVSYGGYPCGSEDDPIIKQARIYNRNYIPPSQQAKIVAKAKSDRVDDLRKRYQPVELILHYGDTLASILESEKSFRESSAKLAKLADTYKGYITGPYGLGLKAFKDFVNISAAFMSLEFQLQISALALESDAILKAAKNDILSKNILKALSEPESDAFKAWDACALDRLYFLRAFNPRAPFFATRARYDSQTNGEMRSSVLDFATLYKTYLDEREAFVGRRADYVGGIDAIIAANNKIAHYDPSFEDFLNLLIGVGDGVNNVRAQYEQARADKVL